MVALFLPDAFRPGNGRRAEPVRPFFTLRVRSWSRLLARAVRALNLLDWRDVVPGSGRLMVQRSECYKASLERSRPVAQNRAAHPSRRRKQVMSKQRR